MVGMNLATSAINVWFLVRLLRDRHDETRLRRAAGPARRRLLPALPRRPRRRHPRGSTRPSPAPSPTTSPSRCEKGDETVGVVLIRREGDVARVQLDYVTPRFRDFSPGEFVWRRTPRLRERGFRRVVTPPGMVAPLLRPARASVPPRGRQLRARALSCSRDPAKFPRFRHAGARAPPTVPPDLSIPGETPCAFTSSSSGALATVVTRALACSSRGLRSSVPTSAAAAPAAPDGLLAGRHDGGRDPGAPVEPGARRGAAYDVEVSASDSFTNPLWSTTTYNRRATPTVQLPAGRHLLAGPQHRWRRVRAPGAAPATRAPPSAAPRPSRRPTAPCSTPRPSPRCSPGSRGAAPSATPSRSSTDPQFVDASQGA